MKLFPAIDIKDGQAVRLRKGVYDDKTVYADEPYLVAMDFEKKGAGFIHLVDLDGARDGRFTNKATVQKIIANVSIPVEIGGGVRTLSDIKERLDIGVNRVILGTALIKDPDLAKEAVEMFGADRIVAGIDAKDGLVCVSGWEEKSQTTAVELCLSMKAKGLKTVIYTDISRDGMLSGPNLEKTKELIDKTGMDIVVSGGVSSIEDLRNAEKIKPAGVIFGKALYEGLIDLEQAVKEFER